MKNSPIQLGTPLEDSVAGTPVTEVRVATVSNPALAFIGVTHGPVHSPNVAHGQRVQTAPAVVQAIRCAPTSVGVALEDSIPGASVVATALAKDTNVLSQKVVTEQSAPVARGDGLVQVDPKFVPLADVSRSGVVVPEPTVTSGQARIEVNTRSPVVTAEPMFHGPAVLLGEPAVDAFSDSPVATPGVTGDVVLQKPGYVYQESRDPISRRRRRRRKA